MSWTPAKVFDAIVRLDKRVRQKRIMPQYRPWKPSGGKAVWLPGSYKKWERTAGEKDIRLFWWYIEEGLWKKAKKLAGLSDKELEVMLAGAHDLRGYTGKAGPETFYVRNVPLFRFLDRVRAHKLQHLLNTDSAVWSKLSDEERDAMRRLAEELEENHGT